MRFAISILLWLAILPANAGIISQWEAQPVTGEITAVDLGLDNFKDENSGKLNLYLGMDNYILYFLDHNDGFVSPAYAWRESMMALSVYQLLGHHCEWRVFNAQYLVHRDEYSLSGIDLLSQKQLLAPSMFAFR